ncbi:hypothetical protein WICPIJ_004101 [Wickerhamomyces pijperi]|uniref:DUF1746 domain-containing protein n=1 Tax=Wickerhamomyces pijperi TaxID=599730 RepID=A0A9P8TMD5_WICPI|nr:hypothetical protein WICPIJ_004101 [Wickerhamomyces pijperi]
MVHIPIDPKEIQANNLRTLKVKKDSFNKNLINSFRIIGFAFICILYLQNISLVRFLLRTALHWIIVDPFPKGFAVTSNQRKSIVKSLFFTLLIINLICVFLDLIVGVPVEELDIGLGGNNGQYLFGGLSIQIIGEQKPSTRLNLLYLNAIIFAIQYCLLYHSTILDLKQSLTSSESTITHLEFDGFSGRTKLSSMNPINVYNDIMNFTPDEEPSSTSQNTTTVDTYDGYLENRLSPGNLNLANIMNSDFSGNGISSGVLNVGLTTGVDVDDASGEHLLKLSGILASDRFCDVNSWEQSVRSCGNWRELCVISTNT